MTSLTTREQVPRILATARPVAPRPAAAAASSSLTASDVSRILQAHKWLIIGFTVSFGVMAGAADYAWLKTAPVWSSSALVELIPPADTALTTTPMPQVDLIERYKLSNQRLVKSEKVLEDALSDESMKQTIQYKAWYQRDPSLVYARKQLYKHLQVSSEPETFLIRIGLSTWTNDQKEKEELATVVNTITESFAKASNDFANQKRAGDLMALGTEIRTAGLRLENVQKSLDEKLRVSKFPDMRKESSSLTMEMQELMQRHTELAVSQAQLAAAKNAIDAQDRKGLLDVNPSVIETLERDPVINRLEAELKMIEAAQDRIRPTMGSNHPQWLEYESSRKSYQTRLDDRKKEITDKAVKALRVGYEQQYTTITNALVEVSERLNEVNTNQREINRMLSEIERLTDEKTQLEKALEQLEQRKRDLELVQQNQPTRILKRADLPIEEDWPKLKVLLPLGIALGIILGVSLAFALELMDTSVKTPTDITRKVDLPLLAMVPHVDDIEEEIDEVRLACLSAPDSLISEAFRELRTNLLFSGPAEQHRTILITSPSPSDGRTTVAVNLAIAMASSGRRVLLVDTNFRRPAVTMLFPEAGQAGLSDVLSGQKAWTQCVHPASSVPNLSVMAAGPLPPNPNELLGHELTARVLDEMGQQFDQVILDGPPLLLISDARVIASQSDSTILVVRAGVNTQGIVSRCRDNLGRIGAHVLGVVLNGVQATAGGYLLKNYEAFYDYHEQSEA